MSIFNLDGWCKLSDEAQAISLKNIRFHLNDGDEKLLAQAEVHLQITGEKEVHIPIDQARLKLVLPHECGPIRDCRLRVYHDSNTKRGRFNLTGYRISDGSLIYTSAVTIEKVYPIHPR